LEVQSPNLSGGYEITRLKGEGQGPQSKNSTEVRKERGEATLSDSTKEPFKDEIHMIKILFLSFS